MTTTRLSRTDAWTFVLPEGWARFPAAEGRERELDSAIRQVAARAVPADLPRDRAEQTRRLLGAKLREAVSGATRAGVGAVYLPVQPVAGVLVPGSIAEIEFDGDPRTDSAEVIAAVLADGYDESETLEIDGRPAARVTATSPETRHADGGASFSSRQVVYALNRDEDRGSWLALSFSVIWNSPETERLADALVPFFDAVMTTFRWAGDDLVAVPSPSAPASTPGSAPPRNDPSATNPRKAQDPR